MSEISNYQNNLKSFSNTLEGAFIEKILLQEDLKPTFDKHSLPFNFSYCLSVTFITNKGNFLLLTAATSFGYETFWTQTIELLKESTSVKFINSFVNSVSADLNLNGVPYKFSVTLEKGLLIFFAAEIYNDIGADYSIKLNDEMVFVFDNELDAIKFETTKNYA